MSEVGQKLTSTIEFARSASHSRSEKPFRPERGRPARVLFAASVSGEGQQAQHRGRGEDQRKMFNQHVSNHSFESHLAQQQEA
jgi:hypothetical protein